MPREREEREPGKRIVRVAFQYGDGTVGYIEGSDAQKFYKEMVEAMSASVSPGAPRWSPKLNWKMVSLPEAREIFG